MPCLLLLLAFTAPRLVIAYLWLFTTWFWGMFDSLLWPALGFLVVPTSLLWYTAVQHWFAGEWTAVPMVGMICALLIDFSPASGERRSRAA